MCQGDHAHTLICDIDDQNNTYEFAFNEYPRYVFDQVSSIHVDMVIFDAISLMWNYLV